MSHEPAPLLPDTGARVMARGRGLLSVLAAWLCGVAFGAFILLIIELVVRVIWFAALVAGQP